MASRRLRAIPGSRGWVSTKKADTQTSKLSGGLSLGLFVGAISNTVGGATGLANILVLPMAFLSGSFFPLDGAPRWLDIVSHALPLRHLNDGMLDVMVRGQGPEAALLPIGILVGFAAVVLLIASRFFSWETD